MFLISLEKFSSTESSELGLRTSGPSGTTGVGCVRAGCVGMGCGLPSQPDSCSTELEVSRNHFLCYFTKWAKYS